MSTLGSLVVSLEANIVKFQSDMGKAAAVAEARMAQIDKSIGIVNTAIKSLGAGLVVGLTLDKIKSKIEGVIESAAGLQILSERTGATVEGLSALAAVAKLSGTDTESLATGLQKLAKSMNEAEHGGQKNIEAFRAIGISVDDLKGQKPDEVFLLISKRLAEYADGAGKTALAQQLLGKAGANLLPVARDLADVGEYQVKVTREQAAMADEYEKNLVRLDAAQNAIAKRIGLELVPVFNAVTEAMLESLKASNGFKNGVDALAADGSISQFAQDSAMALAVLIETLSGVAKAAYAVAKSFQVVYADSKFALQFLDATPAQAYDLIANGAGPLKQALDERNAVLKGANQAYSDAWDFDARAMEADIKQRFAAINAAAGAARSTWGREGRTNAVAQRPGVNFDPTKGSNAATDDPTKRLLEGKLKDQEAFIAAEKSQLQTREQYLQYYYAQEYLDANQYYATKQTLIEDGLKVELEAYDKEAAAITIYLAQAQKLTDQQDARNKLAEVAKKRAAAVVDANKRITDSVLEQAKVYRDFDLATTAVARSNALANDQAQFQIDLMGRNTLEVAQLTEAKRLQLALEDRLYQMRNKNLPQSEMDRAIAETEAQKAAAIDLITQAYEKQRSVAFGANEAFRKYAEDAANAGAQIESAMTNALKGMEDALVTFVTTGKLSFTSLANSIISDIARILIKQNITGPLSELIQGGLSSGSGFGGAIGSFLGGLFGKAGGGPVDAGGMYRVNELGPELLSVGGSQYLMMGSQGGTVTPNGGGSGGGTTVIQNFTVGDVASMAQVKAAVAASQRQVFAASQRSMNYGGALA